MKEKEAKKPKETDELRMKASEFDEMMQSYAHFEPASKTECAWYISASQRIRQSHEVTNELLSIVQDLQQIW